MFASLLGVCVPLLLSPVSAPAQDEGPVGVRPYEMDWAGRTLDDNPPLVNFEDLSGWRVECSSAVASFARTREQQLWDRYVGKLTYRGLTKGGPVVRIVPPRPIPISAPFDAVTLWAYGDTWGYAPDPSRPQVAISAEFEDAAGKVFQVPLYSVDWSEWYVLHRRLTPEQAAAVKPGAKLRALVVAGGTNKLDRALYLDNLAVFTEKLGPLSFDPRPERGIDMFPGQTTGTNTGPDKLPFPTRPQTILPDNLARDFKTSVKRQGDAVVFTYKGKDGELTYTLDPKTGTLGDISARWKGRGGQVRPCVDGGVRLSVDGVSVAPEKLEPLGTQVNGDTAVSRWRVSARGVSAEVTYTYHLWNKSLVVDVFAPGGNVAEVVYGRAQGLEAPRLVTNPFYIYGYGANRPSVVVAGTAAAPLFLTGNTDWCLSNASVPFALGAVKDEGVWYNGGTQYLPKTDGKRNDVYERLFLTLSPRYEEVLPVIPNPVSPWKSVTGTGVWRAHGAGNREGDAAFWTECHRYGMRKVIVTDHETGWRDGGESFTFRTRTAPGKGGDQGQYDYARLMQDKLGFVYGPYNNYTDFAPVNEYWSTDLIGRWSDGQLQHAWMRCYAPKPARAVEYCARLAPIIQSKFKFSTAYCDVHTAVAPWDRTDYDARVPGAGTFAATFYSYGEIMLHQKAAWNGPVYSEGGHHFPYVGLTDGNYGQDSSAHLGVNPWLVDFDLRSMHDHGCNFGMGNPDMFWGSDRPVASSREEADMGVDRFLAATVAFGHPGFLHYEGGIGNALRSYYMLQQLHSRYCLASASDIRYLSAEGRLLETSAALATGQWQRSQIVTHYSDGTVTVVNGNRTERMRATVDEHALDLPPNGYAGWTADGKVSVISGDRDGTRCDYAETPAYLYVDGRGRFTRFPRAASAGQAICRILGGGQYEVIPYLGADCGFGVTATYARALDQAGKDLGPAKLRVARGLTYVVPVEGAFSYLLDGGVGQPPKGLTSARDVVVAGETVRVTGRTQHEFRVPPRVVPGARVWRQFENQWVDFTVLQAADMKVGLEGNTLVATLKSNLAAPVDATLVVGDQREALRLEPGKAAAVRVDLGPPTEELAELLTVQLTCGAARQTLVRGHVVTQGFRPVAALSDTWEAGMRLVGHEDEVGFGDTLAGASPGVTNCGGVGKSSLFMHPPWQGGTGYTWVRYQPLALPAGRPAALRAVVGKGDGSDPGDGIYYRVVVVDAAGKETVAGTQHVTDHVWMPMEADLSPWEGQTVRVKLITDAGPAGDSSGDWGCWADMRVETLHTELVRGLEEAAERYRREPGPYPLAGLTVEELRGAKSGFLRYDGCGLEGGEGQYGSAAVLNGVALGPMAQAGGNELKGIWAQEVGVALTPGAIRTLGMRNRFVLDNHGRDYFKVRRFWLELTLADGRHCSSEVSPAVFTQPGEWQYAEGIGVPHTESITVDIWFGR
jgi:hypothetical protein